MDGKEFTAIVLTGLNVDASQANDYGEKFYDIVDIKTQAKHSAMNGTFQRKATPHKIRFADGSPDMLTVAQKQRIVNRNKRPLLPTISIPTLPLPPPMPRRRQIWLKERRTGSLSSRRKAYLEAATAENAADVNRKGRRMERRISPEMQKKRFDAAWRHGDVQDQTAARAASCWRGTGGTSSCAC